MRSSFDAWQSMVSSVLSILRGPKLFPDERDYSATQNRSGVAIFSRVDYLSALVLDDFCLESSRFRLSEIWADAIF